MPTSRILQLLKFARVFGSAAGFRLWSSLLWQIVLGADMLRLRVPGMTAPVYLRPSDLPIFWQIFVMRENCFDAFVHSTKVVADYRRFTTEGRRPVIIDCGGHVGLSAIWFASKFPKAIVYTIEPDQSNFALLQKNTCAYPNVFPIHGGIWSRSGWLRISNPESGNASHRVQEVLEQDCFGDPNRLRAYTIDDILDKTAGSCLLLVKIDIEGAESELFRCAPTLASSSMIIIELHDWLMPGQHTSRTFFKWLGVNDFEAVLNGENLLLFHSGGSA